MLKRPTKTTRYGSFESTPCSTPPHPQQLPLPSSILSQSISARAPSPMAQDPAASSNSRRNSSHPSSQSRTWESARAFSTHSNYDILGNVFGSVSTDRFGEMDLEVESDLESDNENGFKARRTSVHSNMSRTSRIFEEANGKQWGVLKMEQIGRNWGKYGLLTIYAGVYLLAILTSIEGNTTPTIEPYFLSLLESHAFLGAVAIVTSITYAVGKPPFTKVLDVFGRAEGVALGAFLYSGGYFMTAFAKSAPVYILARSLAAMGAQGIQLSQQIIIADTTTLTNRALVSSTVSLPWILTTWIGPVFGSFFLKFGETGYRTAYGLFACLIPLAASVLCITLWRLWAIAKREAPTEIEELRVLAGMSMGEFRQPSITVKFSRMWRELDVIGLLSLTVGCTGVLLPLTIVARGAEYWRRLDIWLIIILGICAMVFFVIYERKYSPLPLLPSRIIRNRTVLCASCLGFFHFASQFCYENFFTSFLQVARSYSPRDASYIAQSYIFSASVSSIIAGVLAKYSHKYRWIGIWGVLIHMAGTWMMMRMRNMNSTTFELVMSQFIGGVGGGWTTIAAQIGCQSVVSHQDVAVVTGTFLTITQVGGAMGSAIAGTVWSSMLPIQLSKNLPAESQELIPEIVSSLTYALSFPKGTPVREAIDKSYTSVQHTLNWCAMIFLIPALACMCMMRDTHLVDEDMGRGEVVLGRARALDEEDEDEDEETSLIRSSRL